MINLIIYYGCLPSTMDAVSATVFDGGRAIRQKPK